MEDSNFGEIYAGHCIKALWVNTDRKKATKYVRPEFVVKATRRHKYDARERQDEFVVTIGKPNFTEREFVKKAKAAGEPFPIKKIQLK